MLEFLTPDLAGGEPTPRKSKAVPSEGFWSRLAKRLLFRLDVVTVDRPATLYLSSVDLVPMGTCVVVGPEKSD